MKTPVLALSVLLVAMPAVADGVNSSVVFYGHVTRNPLNTAGVTWSLSRNAETLAVSQTMVVLVCGETFNLTLRKPRLESGEVLQTTSDSRGIVDHSRFAAMPGNATPGQLVPEHEGMHSGRTSRITEGGPFPLVEGAGECEAQTVLNFAGAAGHRAEDFLRDVEGNGYAVTIITEPGATRTVFHSP